MKKRGRGERMLIKGPGVLGDNCYYLDIVVIFIKFMMYNNVLEILVINLLVVTVCTLDVSTLAYSGVCRPASHKWKLIDPNRIQKYF